MRIRDLLLSAFLATTIAGGASAAIHTAGAPTTTNNDDSCDIALLPAATLLLPYFEVDLSGDSGTGETTLFSVTNLTNREQIAHVTLWTDAAFPVISFQIFLTGYDVQSINLYDVIAHGQIAPPQGTGVTRSPRGEISDPNPSLDTRACDNLPGFIPEVYRKRMIDAFTRGRVDAMPGLPGCTFVGTTHARAIGYATIDVVSSCSSVLPTEPAFYNGFLRNDNVLTGDYMQVQGAENYAQGTPLVHIRAVEGFAAVNYKTTFYGHYQTGTDKTRDRRQPLPSTFATRWIDGSTGSFETSLKIWRQAVAPANAGCAHFDNAHIDLGEIVKFDEEENPIGVMPEFGGSPPPLPVETRTTSRLGIDDDPMPPAPGNASAGWIYLNLVRQGWLTATMRAEDRYSVDIDAVAMGNGCTPETAASEISSTRANAPVLGPAPNTNPQ